MSSPVGNGLLMSIPKVPEERDMYKSSNEFQKAFLWLNACAEFLANRSWEIK